MTGLVPQLVERWADERPERLAYKHLGFDGAAATSFTWAQMQRRAAGIAIELTARGLRGRPVILLYAPGPEFLPTFFGTLRAGALATPVPLPRFESQYWRLESVALDCTPGAVLATAATIAWLEGRLAEGAALRACPWIATDAIEDRDEALTAPPSADEIALLQYTSGSTAAPRGVVVSHGNLGQNLDSIARAFGLGGEDRVLSWLPHFHDMGLIGGMLSVLHWGGEGILMTPQAFLRRPLRWLEAIAAHSAHASGAPTFAFERCLASTERDPQAVEKLDLSLWRIAYVGAEPIRASTLRRFVERFGDRGFRRESLVPCYGLAEATLLVSCKPKGELPAIYRLDRRELVGCGLPTDASLRIVDPETGTELGPRQVGELWVSGPQIARGYWNGEPFGAAVPTGDLGYLTERGEFVFVERLKDLIVLHGQNYASHDLEQSAAESHELLGLDGCAAGVIETGGGPRLVVAAEFSGDTVARAEEVASAVRGALFTEHGLSVKTVVFVPSGKLSRTTSGKLQRREILQRLSEGRLSTIAWSGEPL